MAKRKAYIVALDEYPNPANNLPSCIADARALEAKLRSTYRFTDIRSAYNAQATLANVQAGIRWLFDGAGPDDSLVFIFSGHGYQAKKGENLEEVLCCYDDFLFDNTLSENSQRLPPGVLTCIFDSCHSGGMYKLVHFDSMMEDRQNKVMTEVAQTKVLKVPPAGETEKVFMAGPVATSRIRYKPFGAPPADVSAIAKRFDPVASKAFEDEEGDLEMNGLLLSASLEDETASASTPRTDGKSAFTFALLEQLDALGPNVSTQQLLTAVETKLRDLGFRQTPVRMEGRRPGNLATRPFLLLEPRSEAVTAEINPDAIIARLRELLAVATTDKQPTKEYTMPETMTGQPMPVDDKSYRAAMPIASEVALAIYQDLEAQNIDPQKDFQGTPGGEDKFWNFVAQAAVAVAPYVIDALRKGGYEPQKGLGIDEKSFWDAARPALMAVLPVLYRELTKAGLEPVGALAEGEKGWLSRLGQLAATGLEIAMQSLAKQGAAPKGFALANIEDKGWWDRLRPVISTVGSALLNHLAKTGVDPQKDFAGSEEKLWGGLISGAIAAARSVYRGLQNKQIDLQKDFDGEDKFWSALGAGLRFAAPLIRSLTKGEPTKAFGPGEPTTMGVTAGTPSDEVDEKLFGVLRAAMPEILRRLTES